jgi:putative DNA primase/helicase
MLSTSKTSKQVNKQIQHKPQAKTQRELAPKEMQDFIRFLRGDSKLPVLFQSFSKNPNLALKSATFSSNPTLELRDRLVADNKLGLNVSAVVNTINGKKRKAENVTKINAVFIDCDNRSHTSEQLMALPVVPNMVVETSPGNFHAYWLVSDCGISEFKNVQRALAERFNSDPQVCDLARSMRIPGTINWKHDKPFLARIVHRGQHAPVAISKLIKKLKLRVELNDSTADAKEKQAAPVALSHNVAVTPAQIEAALDRISSDDRVNWLRVGMAIHSEMPNQEGYELWTAWSNSSDKFDAADQRRTWDSFKPSPHGIKIGTLFGLAGAKGNAKSDWDNFRMGSLFVQNYGYQLRFEKSNDSSGGTWYLFNGVTWQRDRQAPLRLAKALVEDLHAGEGRSENGMNGLRSAAALKAICQVVELDESIQILSKDFDANPNLLAVRNGVVDLVTGEFRAARASEYLRRQADVDYDPDAKCPRWIEFIRQVTCGNKELARFLRLAVGYTLFGHAKMQVFFILEGIGRNGKGVFLRTLRAILGEYATELPTNITTSGFSGSANASSPALMAIQGRRLGIITETSARKTFDSAFMKTISGGDAISARANYGEQTTIKPECKLWLSTNSMPEVAANDFAMWRRIVPIPFKAKFDDATDDRNLDDKLREEASGILNWAIAGAQVFAEEYKLPDCEAVAKHKAQLRRDADVCGSWLKECTTPVPKGRVQASEAYASYAKFAKKIGRDPMNVQAFKNRMSQEGYHNKKSRDFNVYAGVVLKEASK